MGALEGRGKPPTL